MFTALLLLLSLTTLAQAPKTADTYTKEVHLIPMRDGVKLYTVVYVPKKLKDLKPIMLTRTPYGVGPYEEGELKPYLGPSNNFSKAGYIIAYQDVRGKYMSEGTFQDMKPYRGPHNHAAEIRKKGAGKIDESTDAWDTIEYLTKKIKGNNGRVGMWGISYPGFYASQALLDAHPALKAVSPQAPVADWWTGDDFRRNGVLLVPHAFNFFTGFGLPRPVPIPYGQRGYQHTSPDGYQFFLQAGSTNDLLKKYTAGNISFMPEAFAHADYDTFWAARNAIHHFKNVKPASMVVGGWYDTENLYGALQDYQSIERQNAKAHNHLVMGPWWHGQWARDSGNHIGQVRYGQASSVWYRDSVEYPFFKHYLENGSTAPAPIAEATVFYTGANQWKRHASWPPAKAEKLRFRLFPNGVLKAAAASDAMPAVGLQETEASYVADPNKPVPYSTHTSPRMEKEYMVEDQRPQTRRTDVLSWTSPALEAPLTLSGKARIRLKLKSTATDADFFVKIIDVHPSTYGKSNGIKGNAASPAEGYEMLLGWDAMRARYRDGGDKPKAIKPGEVFEINLPLNDIAHTLRPGHKLMVQVHSSWFPICERHPQQFINVHEAQPQDYKVATHTVLLGDSYVELDVTPSE